MKSQLRYFYLIAFVLVFSLKTYAQQTTSTAEQSVVEVLNADIQDGVNLENARTQTFTGNVIFKHRGVLMGTDKAIQNQSNNTIEAFGRIKFNQGDTLTIVGDTLFYEGNSRIATIWGKNVILRDKKVTLKTRKIIYNMVDGMVHYPVPGTITQDSSVLTSKKGYYDTRNKYFNYIGDVVVTNPDFVLKTDSMDYDTHSKRAIFKSFTTVTSDDGVLTAKEGWYNIQNKQSYFAGRSKVDNEEYSLEGDTLNFDSNIDFGWAKGNVIFVSKKDSVVSVGNEGIRIGKEGLTKMNGETITKLLTAKDTAYIAADTLVIFEKPKLETEKKKDDKPKTENLEKVIAIGGVKVFRSDMQSISDSLIYNAIDSTISYYKKPTLWHLKNQLKADSIQVFLKNDNISRLEMVKNCFMIERDTLNNFNQMKGREITAFFTDSSKIEEIHITGNAESKYFVLDDNLKIIGLNTQLASSMKFLFSNGELEFIKAYIDVDEELIPPSELTEGKARFADFEYKIDEKPTLEKIMALRLAPLLNQARFD